MAKILSVLGPNPVSGYPTSCPYGKYRFNVQGEFRRKGLRPLRRPDSVMA